MPIFKWRLQALTGERLVLLGLTLTACVAIGVGFASFQSVSRLRDEGFWIAQTQEVISTLEEVLSTATDAETSGRGYAITGDVAHLEPYTAAVEKNSSTTTRLSHLVSNGGRFRKRKI